MILFHNLMILLRQGRRRRNTSNVLLGYREISFVAVPVYVSLVVLYESFTSVIKYDYVEYLNGNKHRDRLKMFLRFSLV